MTFYHPLQANHDELSTMTGYGVDKWSSICSMTEILLFSTMPRPAVGTTQPPIQWLLGAPWG